VASSVIRALLADDHAEARDGLARALAGSEDIRVVAAMKSSGRIRQQVERLRPDVRVLDASFASGDGIGVLEGLKGLRPEPRVLILSLQPDADLVLPSFRRRAELVFLHARDIR